ncbi:MAG: Holliday junction branch migration protein RuvA [Hyphomicrobiales bacterium]|nr:Holliday junction branch migration protein RuvA [Hyphomicrobiales bacterium]MCY4048782.1 Holliday junction branch migration protein RuvA [Hyphomicrobiales bacterium]
MIAKLRGRVDEIGASFAILDVGGVGYRVECSARTLSALPAAGEEAGLLTEQVTQEDKTRLYGFGDESERDWFVLLLGIQGIGARMALALLGVLSPEALAQSIRADDSARLTSAPGIGTRLARRITTELKDKELPETPGDVAVSAEDGAAARKRKDAVAALIGLGYARAQAHEAVAKVLQSSEEGDGINIAELIRASLRLLAKAS